MRLGPTYIRWRRAHAVRPVLRGVRGRRGVQALAGQDGHRVRRPPVLPADDEPPPAAPGRALRRADDRLRQERRGGQLHLLAAARHVGAGRQRQGHRQPRGRVAASTCADLPRRHHLRRDDRAGQDRVAVEGRPRRRARRDPRLQPGRRRGVRLPAQGDGAEAVVRRGARRRAARPPRAPAPDPRESCEHAPNEARSSACRQRSRSSRRAVRRRRSRAVRPSRSAARGPCPGSRRPC